MWPQLAARQCGGGQSCGGGRAAPAAWAQGACLREAQRGLPGHRPLHYQ